MSEPRPRISDEELPRWIEAAQKAGGGVPLREVDGIPYASCGVPYFGAAVFDLLDARAALAAARRGAEQVADAFNVPNIAMHLDRRGDVDSIAGAAALRALADKLAAAESALKAASDGPYRPYADSHPEEPSFYVHDEKDRPVAQVGDLDEAQRVALMLNTLILRARRAESALKVEQARDWEQIVRRLDEARDALAAEQAEHFADVAEAARQYGLTLEELRAEQAAHAETRRERDEARTWAEDLANRAREVTCVWCGHQFESTLKSQAEHLYEHAKVCDKHPIHKAEAALKVEQEARQREREVIEAAQAWSEDASYDGALVKALAKLRAGGATPEAQRTSAPIGSPSEETAYEEMMRKSHEELDKADRFLRREAAQRAAGAGPQGAETSKET